MPATHRLNVEISEHLFQTLRQLAKRKEQSMSAVLSDAIELEVWFQDTRAAGARVVVEHNGVRRELIRQ